MIYYRLMELLKTAISSTQVVRRNQNTFISPDILKQLFERESILTRYIQPDFSSLGAFDPIPLVKGTNFTVYKGNMNGEGEVVIKVENIRKPLFSFADKDCLVYPWVKTGMGEKRSRLTTIQDAVMRKEEHQEIKKRLEIAGFETPLYIGSLLLDSKERRKELKIPLYAEIWKNPGGVMMKDGAWILYRTPEGRAILKDAAYNLLNLSKTGFLYSAEENGFIPFTEEDGFPFMYGVMIVCNEKKTQKPYRAVALDCNGRIDLTRQPWWNKNWQIEEELLKRDQRGRLVANPKLVEWFTHDIENLFYGASLDNPKEDPFDELIRIQQIREKEVFLTQAQYFYTQICISAAMLDTVEQLEKSTPN